MLRTTLIERILRAVYGEQPTDDSNITQTLVNEYITTGLGVAARLNYKDAISLDGVAYVNNSFYSTFKGITFSQDENFIYKATLPQIPIGIGKNEGISSMVLKDSAGNLSYDCIPISEAQWTYYINLPKIPNKILYKPEGQFIYAISTLLLNNLTANVVMVSGGDVTNLNSTLNCPDDYIEIVYNYCVERLKQERATPKDISNDGSDN